MTISTPFLSTASDSAKHALPSILHISSFLTKPTKRYKILPPFSFIEDFSRFQVWPSIRGCACEKCSPKSAFCLRHTVVPSFKLLSPVLQTTIVVSNAFFSWMANMYELTSASAGFLFSHSTTSSTFSPRNGDLKSSGTGGLVP